MLDGRGSRNWRNGEKTWERLVNCNSTTASPLPLKSGTVLDPAHSLRSPDYSTIHPSSRRFVFVWLCGIGTASEGESRLSATGWHREFPFPNPRASRNDIKIHRTHPLYSEVQYARLIPSVSIPSLPNPSPSPRTPTYILLHHPPI